MRVRREVGLSRERICRAALELVDDEGLEALSMRRLAAVLDCEAMSLYKHVADKEDLLDAVHAAVLGTLRPETKHDHIRAGRDYERLPPWRLLLGGLARALRTALLRHPNVLPLFTSRPVVAPEALHVIDEVRAAFAHAGFDRGHAERAIYVVGMFTIGHTLFEKSERRDATFHFGLEALLDGIARDHRRQGKHT